MEDRTDQPAPSPPPWTERQSRALMEGAAAFGLVLTGPQVSAFRRYYEELVDWNQRMNLTAITDPDAVVERHFLDSLSCLLAFPEDLPSQPRLIDVGAGAGLPGIPLKLARPEVRLALLEATRKKAAFLVHIVAVLQLSDTAVLAGRAEDLGRDSAYREQFDLATSRAVAEMAVLAEYCLPFLRVGGRLIAPKRTGIENEIAAGRGAIAALGARLGPAIVLPGDPSRQLVVVDKTAPTPSAYPRRAGLPSRQPLGMRRTTKAEDP